VNWKADDRESRAIAARLVVRNDESRAALATGEFAAVEYTHSAANAERLETVVRAIESGVSGGAFPAVPGEEDPRGGFENCAYCDFDRICSRRRLAEFTNRAPDDSIRPWARVQEIAKGGGDA
jgi:hypothetical protein